MTRFLCTNGCNKPVVSYGLCNACYLRKRHSELSPEEKAAKYVKHRARSKERGYDQSFHERNREKRKAEMRSYAKRVSSPVTIEDWERYIWRRIRLNAHNRGDDLSYIPSKETIASMLHEAVATGDVSLSAPIKAPSPDRLDNNKGYIAGNIQIVPRWLNLARNCSDTGEIKEAILDWAGRRLT